VETAVFRGKSRRQKRKGQGKRDRKISHFRTVCFGGFDEAQIICCLWDIVKALETGREVEKEPDTGRATDTGQSRDAKREQTSGLEKQLRRQIRVEMRRYFVRKKRRNVRLLLGTALCVLCAVGLFGFLIGIDRVSGNSMYPYLNHGDWIVYSRTGGSFQRDEVVVFEKNGENLVKRIAGLPGDTVEISPSGGRVVVNGIQIRENYVTLTDQTEKEDRMGAPQTVLDGQYLVLGDNRSVSIDSRDSGMGTVPAASILGRVVLIVRTKN